MIVFRQCSIAQTKSGPVVVAISITVCIAVAGNIGQDGGINVLILVIAGHIVRSSAGLEVGAVLILGIGQGSRGF